MSVTSQNTRTEYLRLDEAADLLKVNPATIRLWANTKGLPRLKIGRSVRYRRADIEAWAARFREEGGRND